MLQGDSGLRRGVDGHGQAKLPMSRASVGGCHGREECVFEYGDQRECVLEVAACVLDRGGILSRQSTSQLIAMGFGINAKLLKVDAEKALGIRKEFGSESSEGRIGRSLRGECAIDCGFTIADDQLPMADCVCER